VPVSCLQHLEDTAVHSVLANRAVKFMSACLARTILDRVKPGLVPEVRTAHFNGECSHAKHRIGILG
jgi:hypothetical protein